MYPDAPTGTQHLLETSTTQRRISYHTGCPWNVL